MSSVYRFDYIAFQRFELWRVRVVCEGGKEPTYKERSIRSPTLDRRVRDGEEILQVSVEACRSRKTSRSATVCLLIACVVSALMIPAFGPFDLGRDSMLDDDIVSIQYDVHDPIFINGNEEFTSANGVTGGNGTVSDPYVIEGWAIETTMNAGILIVNTDAHFTIRNCYIHGSGTIDYNPGIELGWPSCTNGTVTGNTCSSNSVGISLLGSSNNTLNNNTCSGCANGMMLFRSDNNTLSGNNCSSNGFGVALDSSSNNTLSNNTGNSNSFAGILLDSGIGEDFPMSNENTLSNNTCSHNDHGIYLYRAKYNTLSDNNCSYNEGGIELCGSSNNNTLTNNTCSSNFYSGIRLDQSSNNNTLTSSTCSSNADGIGLYSSSNNILSDNDCSDNTRGIHLSSSSNNTLSDNSCSSNTWAGIHLGYSGKNSLSSNNCSSNSACGIRLTCSSNNTIDYGECNRNDLHGIWLGNASDDNTLSDTNLSSNDANGIHISDSSGTIVYRNIFINNTDNHAYDDSGVENLWNASYPMGGNYWDNYTGVDEFSGPSQDQPGPDGIGDTPYEIDVDSFDYYPLMAPPDTPPTASFTTSPSTGDLTTLFSFDASDSWDSEDSLEALEIRWDFDGDGEWDTDWSAEKVAQYQYTVPGEYTVRLEVRDTDGLTDNATVSVEVVEAIPEFSAILVPVLSLLLMITLVANRRRNKK